MSGTAVSHLPCLSLLSPIAPHYNDASNQPKLQLQGHISRCLTNPVIFYNHDHVVAFPSLTTRHKRWLTCSG